MTNTVPAFSSMDVALTRLYSTSAMDQIYAPMLIFRRLPRNQWRISVSRGLLHLVSENKPPQFTPVVIRARNAREAKRKGWRLVRESGIEVCA